MNKSNSISKQSHSSGNGRGVADSTAAVAVKQEFSDQEVLTIQQKLDKQLGPEYVSTRPGAGGIRVSYIEGWKALNLANQVFGFNNWNSEVKTIQVDYMDEKQGRFSVGLSCVVRVTLKDGSFHEDIGYGSLDNARTKAMAFEKAKKEAMTDGLKRALRCFGNAMGNCLYDKEYLSKISGIKCAPPDFDESNLMRYTDLAPSRSTTVNGNSRANTFGNHENNDNSNRPSAPHRPAAPPPQAPQPIASKSTFEMRQTVPEKRPSSGNTNPHKRREIDDVFDDSLTFSDDLVLESEDFNDEVNELLDTKMKTPGPEENGKSEQSDETFESNANPNPDQVQPTNDTPSRAPLNQQVSETQQVPSEVGFFKARVAEEVQKNSPNVLKTHAFNPQFISPSIRRTVDPTKSTPIKRTELSKPATTTTTNTTAPNPTISNSNPRFDNPRLMPHRQIGRPRYPPPRQVKDSTKEKAETGS